MLLGRMQPEPGDVSLGAMQPWLQLHLVAPTPQASPPCRCFLGSSELYRQHAGRPPRCCPPHLQPSMGAVLQGLPPCPANCAMNECRCPPTLSGALPPGKQCRGDVLQALRDVDEQEDINKARALLPLAFFSESIIAFGLTGRKWRGCCKCRRWFVKPRASPGQGAFQICQLRPVRPAGAAPLLVRALLRHLLQVLGCGHGWVPCL